MTLLLSTRQRHGVIVYHGVDEHLAVELFLGRLRVSYNIGNYPVSTMFSYEQLSDGECVPPALGRYFSGQLSPSSLPGR